MNNIERPEFSGKRRELVSEQWAEIRFIRMFRSLARQAQMKWVHGRGEVDQTIDEIEEEIQIQLLAIVIDGVGPKIGAKLIEQFGSLDAVVNVTTEELQKIGGIKGKAAGISRQMIIMKNLITEFRSLEAMAGAKREQLQRVKGLTKEKARKIERLFRKLVPAASWAVIKSAKAV